MWEMETMKWAISQVFTSMFPISYIFFIQSVLDILIHCSFDIIKTFKAGDLKYTKFEVNR